MKITTTSVLNLSCLLLGLSLMGCAQQQTRARYPAPGRTGPGTAQPSSARQFGPAYAIVEQNGVLYTRSSMVFPTGQQENGGLLVEKTVPVEVLTGQPFEYRYKVSNLTEHPIHMVTVSDRLTGSFDPGDIDPQPSDTRQGVVTWRLGNMGGKEVRIIRVQASGKAEGALNTCGWASYSPLLCEDIKVVKPGIQLSESAPAEVLVCDAIPVTLTVKNVGSSALSGVKVLQSLPMGLLSDGKTNLLFDAGALAAGQSHTFTFNLSATNTGKFTQSAKVTCLQGVEAEASAPTTVREPVLKISSVAPEERYMGRPFDVTFTIANTGDATSTDTVLEVPIASGLTFNAGSGGGRLEGNKVLWNLGSLAADASQQVNGTFVAANSGTFQFNATAKGTCAKPASAVSQTRVVGVSAMLLEKADEPDPIQTGESTTFTVKVTNQGSAEERNVRMVVTFPAELAPSSSSSQCTIEGQTVSFPVVPVLAPKANVSYKILAKGAKAGDARTRFSLTADGLSSPVIAEESTRVY